MLFVSIDKLLIPHDLLEFIDGIELRLDLFSQLDFSLINGFIKDSSKPVMLTLRSSLQGGGFKGTERERESTILKLLSLDPAFFDLEYDMREEFLQKALQNHPLIKFILSHHALEKKTEDKAIHDIYAQMEKYPSYGYKLAVQVSSTNEALEMLLFSKSRPKLSVICMGEKGSFARVLGPIVGNVIDYAALNEETKTAPGQLSVSELTHTYYYHRLNPQTTLYGLIGDPVEKSQGHLYHNRAFAEKNCNAVYVKMSVKKEELSLFFHLAKKMGFRGLSVTMPLKESVYPLTSPVDSKDKAIQAVNTLLLQKDKILSTNTDGKGALDAIEKKTLVKNKIVVIIGAGGAARAIAFEAKDRGATLWILNRTIQKAIDLSQEIGCSYGFLHDIPLNYDILINCSPDPGKIDLSGIKPFTLVMDVVYNPRETLFLQRASRLGAKVIYGEEMFWNQAAAQTSFWC